MSSSCSQRDQTTSAVLRLLPRCRTRRWLDDDFQVRVLSLIRFQRRLTGRSSGPLPKTWQITRRHRQRLTLMVRALDAHLADASYREIADALYGAEAVTRY